MKYVSVVFVALFCLLLASCSSENGDAFPQIADPPPFDYVDGVELRSSMHQLAYTLLRLDVVLVGEDEEYPVDQDEVVETLRRILQIAESLQDSDLRSRHPYLVGDMYRFLNDVDRAIIDASRRSPSYYMAGRISGACVACHRAIE